jgi:hypothetical protein
LKIENIGCEANIKAFVVEKNAELERLAREVASKSNKPINITLKLERIEERIVTVDVPRVVKTGLFKKETVIEQETKTERHVREEELDGWILESFSREEREGLPVGYHDWWDCWNFCLGKDGKMYVDWSYGCNYTDGSRPESNNRVFECLYNSPMLMSPEENVLISVVNGLIGALDTVKIDASAQSRTWILAHEPDDVFTFDFPLEITENDKYPYLYGAGTINRLAKLLD